MVLGSMAVDVPFIGRVDELGLLRRYLDGALAGHPRIVLLSGDAGVGKSRLLSEAMVAATEAGVEVLFGTCYEDGGIPYLALATALRRVDHEGARRLDPRRRTEPVQGADPESAEAGRLQLYLDVTAALVDTAADRPTLLVIDDVHWADDASADLLRHVVLSSVHEATLAELPLLVVLSA
jgi:predicted ATPase